MAKVSHWLFGNITVQLRTNPRPKVVIRKPVPWDDRNKNYRDEIMSRPALHTATVALREVSRRTGGIKLKFRKELIRQALKDQDYGGKKPKLYASLNEAQFRQKLDELTNAVVAARQEAERLRAERQRQVVVA